MKVEKTSDALMNFHEDGTPKAKPGEVVVASAQKVADAHGHGHGHGEKTWWQKAWGTEAVLAVVTGILTVYGLEQWAHAHGIYNIHDLVNSFNPHAPTLEEYQKELEIQTKYGAKPFHDAFQFTATPEQVQKDFINELGNHDRHLTPETIDAVKAAGGYVDEYGITHETMVGPHGRPLFIAVPNTPEHQHPNYPRFYDGKWDLHPHPATEAAPAAAPAKPATEPPPIPGTRPQESIQGPNDSTPDSQPTPKDTPPPIHRPSADDYKTAQLNLGQIAQPIEGLPEIELNPSPEQIDSFKEAAAVKLGINPWEISDDVAKDAIMHGGYSDHGHSFELWQSNTGDTVYITERPTNDMPQLGETSKLPLLEISDPTKDALITGTAVLEDPLTSDFNADTSGYEPGSPEDKAWQVAHQFLVEHEQVYGDSWRETPTRLSEYLTLIGVYKS